MKVIVKYGVNNKPIITLIGNLDEMVGMLELKYQTHEAFANINIRHESVGGGIADEELVYEHHQLADEARNLVGDIQDSIEKRHKFDDARKQSRAENLHKLREGMKSRLEQIISREAIERLIAESPEDAYGNQIELLEPPNGEGA